ncbi:hypothetical protein LIER_06603 [Lithospermum erythrorhizon]|uniref:Uncharacterized protein n=1 Tax=Lithospermum erythrorhizon TaxID=34254 RepID=A0AAV3P541_LITER
MRITPEAGELENDYCKSIRAYLNYRQAQAYPMFSTGIEDDENIPEFFNLNLPLKKLDKIDTRLSMLEERVACMEGVRPDAKLIKLNAAKLVQNMFSYKFDILKYTIEKELRATLNL